MSNLNSMGYTLICSPVNRWSKPEAIQKWLDTLTSWPKVPQRDNAIADAQKWLASGYYAGAGFK